MTDYISLLSVLIVCALLGYLIVPLVPGGLRTGLLSVVSLLQGVILIGALWAMGRLNDISSGLQVFLGFLAVFMATVCFVGARILAGRVTPGQISETEGGAE